MNRESKELTRPLATLFEGAVDYQTHWGMYARADGQVDRRYDMFFGDSDSFVWEMSGVNADTWAIRAPDASTQAESKEQWLWNELGEVWEWLKRNARHDRAAYYKLFVERPGKGWPAMWQYAAAIAKGRMPYGACFSTAHILATLWHHAGLSPWRQAIVGASHKLTTGGDPRHWYVALWLGGVWWAIDPAGVRLYAWPKEPAPIVPHGQKVDYAHPRDAVILPGGPDFVPLLVGGAE